MQPKFLKIVKNKHKYFAWTGSFSRNLQMIVKVKDF